MINVLWLHSDKMGCGTYRCMVPALTLQDQGVADSNFLLHTQVGYEVPVHDLDGMDVVVFQRAIGTVFRDTMKACQQREILTVVELDDDLFHIPRQNPASFFWRTKPVQRLLREQLEMADRIITSTQPLADIVTEEMHWRTQDKIRVCPNHLHPAVWGPGVWGEVKPYDNKHVVIGWQGSTTHEQDFKEALPALKRLIDEDPDLMIRFFGCVPLTVKAFIPEARFQWTRGVPFENYPATLRFVNYDIGIAPIVQNRFNESKSNIKWLEYSALGIPCVASRVYPYASSIEEGVTGFLASTPNEWYAKLKALLGDPGLRATIGQRAKQSVWSRWNHLTMAPRWADAFLSGLDGRKLRVQRLIQGTTHGQQLSHPELGR